MIARQLGIEARRVLSAAARQGTTLTARRLPWAINNALRGFGLPWGYAAEGYLTLLPASMRP